MDIAIYEKELEIKRLELKLMCDQLDSPFFMEKGDGGVISNIFKKIRSILNSCKNAIINFFSSDKFKKRDEKIEDVMNKNPSLRNMKVKVKDYQKLDSLNNKTLREFKSGSDPALVIEKYKKQRNAILTGSGIILTAVAAIGFLKKRKDNRLIQNLIDTTVDWEKKAEEILKADGKKITQRQINKTIHELQKNVALQAIGPLQAKVKAYQPFVDACVSDNTTLTFQELSNVYRNIESTMNKRIENQQGKVDKYTNSTDEVEIRQRDKAVQKLNDMKNMIKS